MRRACGVLFSGIVLLPILTNAQNVPAVAQSSAVKATASTVVRRGWVNDEAMLAKAIAIRTHKLEGETGFQFDKNWSPIVRLEWGLGEGASGFDATYKPETETVYFPIRIIYELAVRQRHSAGPDANTAAADDEISELIDHELGHELMDQVSRRNGLGPWFTEARFNASSEEEKIGLDILSEGTAQFFQRLNFPRDDSDFSERMFPATREGRQFYTYRMIAFDGGYWMVRDVLNKYGERGLIWLMRHPFVARDDMRAAAVAYRDRALKELAGR